MTQGSYMGKPNNAPAEYRKKSSPGSATDSRSALITASFGSENSSSSMGPPTVLTLYGSLPSIGRSKFRSCSSDQLKSRSHSDVVHSRAPSGLSQKDWQRDVPLRLGGYHRMVVAAGANALGLPHAPFLIEAMSLIWRHRFISVRAWEYLLARSCYLNHQPRPNSCGSIAAGQAA